MHLRNNEDVRGIFRPLNRLPVLAQFLLVPLPVMLAALAYGAWRWTHADWGALQTGKSHGYHVLGWTVLPLTLAAAGLFAAVVGRGVRGRRTGGLLCVTCMVVLAIFVLMIWRSSDLSACACDGG
jgi:hypothetical protein